MFKKKKKQEQPVETQPVEIEVKTPCELFGHVWQDTPWYIENTWDNDRSLHSFIALKEKYICRVCHEIKDITLWQEYEGINRKAHDEKVKRIQRQFENHIQPEAIVMDMIHDWELVDRQKLKYWEQLHAPEKPEEKEPFELNIPEKHTLHLHSPMQLID